MKELTFYALETLACSGVLLAAYVILLERRVRFGWCRAYLLLSTLAAAVIPLLRIPVWPGPVTEAAPVVTAGVWDMQAEIVPDEAPALAPETVVTAVYAFGVLLLFGLMLWQALRIRSLRRGAAVTQAQGFTLVRTPQRIASFSFFRSIYVWQGVPDAELPAILAHETSHINHRHSTERIAMECMKALLWWNPFAWIAARRLPEAEEFEADSDVLAGGFDLENYMHVLLKQLFGYTPEIANGLRNSLTKKRFQMMTTKTSGRYALLRLAGTLPAVIGLLFAFSFTTRAAVIVLPDAGQELSAPAAECNVTVVVTREGQFLPGALVRIAGTERGTTTDANGKAKIAAAAGTELEISYIDCKTVRTTVTPDGKGPEILTMIQLTAAGSATADANSALPAAPAPNKPAKTTEAGQEGVRVHVALIGKNDKGFMSRNAAVGAIVKRPNTNIGTVTDSEGNATIAAGKGDVLEVQYPEYATSALVVVDPKETHRILLYPAGTEQKKEVPIFARDEDGVIQAPLYIYDGVERANLSGLQTNAIDSIYILKGKDATDLYGERGRNGVVIITSNRKRKAQAAVNEDEPFLIAETMPAFRGGDLNVFRTWVQSQVAYPRKAVEQNIQGRVVVSFVVERDGSVSNVSMLQSPDKLLSDEVRRVFEEIPAGSWTPGKQKDRLVRVRYLIPVDFRMTGDAAPASAATEAKTGLNPDRKSGGKEALLTAETMPSFQGGNVNAFRTWVQTRVRYPETALKQRIMGRVVATFIIEKDGSVSNVDILQSPDGSLADEVRRVLAATPSGSWKPGMEQGKAVRVKHTIPVDFRMEGSVGRTPATQTPGAMNEIVVVGYETRANPTE